MVLKILYEIDTIIKESNGIADCITKIIRFLVELRESQDSESNGRSVVDSNQINTEGLK